MRAEDGTYLVYWLILAWFHPLHDLVLVLSCVRLFPGDLTRLVVLELISRERMVPIVFVLASLVGNVALDGGYGVLHIAPNEQMSARALERRGTGTNLHRSNGGRGRGRGGEADSRLQSILALEHC